ncbi:hypothetical protein HB976_09890 [Yersinia mollaretii]|uniref:hypothetical protein n=1 Tax=Yersinia mollaretii TaxID=33060 RepID=UPI001427E0BD|nr:hypothetical protein [Yersinia mollaretii]MDA5535205.1 hypothetical protein [Yersinia mollaretii]NIL03262.1 hypothetical protein [Yersinia mollaretii]
MRLIGSRTESLRREELVQSGITIKKNEAIDYFLNEKFSPIKSAYVLACTPEQGEDFYRIIVNGDIVVEFEISRADSTITDIEEISVEDYSKLIKSKSDKLDLIIALDLANNK